MSKTPRKSIVASFGLLSAELETKLNADQSEPAPSPTHPVAARVGAGVIGAAHRAIDDIRSERDRLKAMVESGGGAIQDLDPQLVDASPFPDRLRDDDNAGFEALKRSIDVDGQKVPVQVRKHPSTPGRYQIVYGHRRWQAVKDLGKTLRAIEVEMSDLDLVVAQGIENANRQDLTWIERALFASRMDSAGIKPRDIYAALSIEDAELARMRGVYRAIPEDIIEAIGRAPKVGRPRWLDLAKVITGEAHALARAREFLINRAISTETSDQRFQRTLELLKPKTAVRGGTAQISDSSGRRLGALLISEKEMRISAEGSQGKAFLKFIEAQLPELAERFAEEAP